jgi:hypothetical protein
MGVEEIYVSPVCVGWGRGNSGPADCLSSISLPLPCLRFLLTPISLCIGNPSAPQTQELEPPPDGLDGSVMDLAFCYFIHAKGIQAHSLELPSSRIAIVIIEFVVIFFPTDLRLKDFRVP